MRTPTSAHLKPYASPKNSPSPFLTARKPPPKDPSQDQLDSIFQSVRHQIDLWGKDAKWKIDLVLMEDRPSHKTTGSPNMNRSLSPAVMEKTSYAAHSPLLDGRSRRSLETQQTKRSSALQSLPVSATIECPWDYEAPSLDMWQNSSSVNETKLRESIEQQQYLENIIQKQSQQIKHTQNNSTDVNDVIETMRSIFMMSEHEQRLRFSVEKNMLTRDIHTLTEKLRRINAILQTIETMDVRPQDAQLSQENLMEDRRILLRKLHLSHLRLSAKDAEIDYLREQLRSLDIPPPSLIRSLKSQPLQKFAKGPPYLFQQQYSPQMRSDIRPSPATTDSPNMSGLASLGIVADRMLSNPDFETKENKPKAVDQNLQRVADDLQQSTSESPAEDFVNNKRSKRSIDSATALLSMPNMVFPTKDEESTPTIAEETPVTDNAQNGKRARLTYVRWSPEEDDRLRQLVKTHGASNWDAVAEDMPNRTGQQCRQRWTKYLDTKNDKKANVDARHSPSIAALLDTTEDYKARETKKSPPSQPDIRFSPHTTPPLTHPEIMNKYHPPQVLPPDMNYRPPSPISTPKDKWRATIHTDQ
ncbi:uncharacterized protein BYT42DRAFT_572785 [Radiomyces spectabilis]|uniref:uncharacterized protein n=1 Tax=Radiomyces spectabilis TaxID=64574 RepID=UPI00221FAC3F|nr:uncharacterized protein BYT42DRAFT_572785 [Radiomyces spectabilis]KAI8375919.1 hypothetical protein BYT42DRAFT_572785 [Radiomyces spectabilis]